METNKSPFRKIDDQIAYLAPVVSKEGSGPGLILANFTSKTRYLRLDMSWKEITDVSDRDLIRLWPHRTRARINGKNAMEDKMYIELMERGYIRNAKGKWRKAT